MTMLTIVAVLTMAMLTVRVLTMALQTMALLTMALLWLYYYLLWLCGLCLYLPRPARRCSGAGSSMRTFCTPSVATSSWLAVVVSIHSSATLVGSKY